MRNTAINIPKKVVWLASYPKSGNTWFRAFLTALINDGNVDINDIKTDGIFSSRKVFDRCTDLDSTCLYDAEEAKILLPEVINHLAAINDKDKLFIKVHDAYTINQAKQPIIPAESTLCAIYFIRNPLDIAGSLSNHNNTSISKAVHSLVDNNYAFAPQNGNLNTVDQFRQFLSNWSFHVESWTLRPTFPVYVIRYEDMVNNTFDIFKGMLKNIGLKQYNDTQILNAIEASSFTNLRKQEQEKKFNETNKPNSSSFFRKGSTNNWKNELTAAQTEHITRTHKNVMKKYGYLLPNDVCS